MPKQDRRNHTKARQFRFPEVTMAKLEELERALGINRTTILKLAIDYFHARKIPKKNLTKSQIAT